MMIRRLTLFFLLCTVSLHAQTRTSIHDTLYNADGSRTAGQIEITWNPFRSADGKTIAAGKITRRITDGVLDLALVPNAGATPAGTSYAVTYLLASGLSYSETWVVPQSDTPVSLAAVRVSVAPSPAPSVQVGQQQLSEGEGLQVLLDFYRAASQTATRAGQCYWNTTASALHCSTGAGAWQSYAPGAVGRGDVRFTGTVGSTYPYPAGADLDAMFPFGAIRVNGKAVAYATDSLWGDVWPDWAGLIIPGGHLLKLLSNDDWDWAVRRDASEAAANARLWGFSLGSDGPAENPASTLAAYNNDAEDGFVFWSLARYNTGDYEGYQVVLDPNRAGGTAVGGNFKVFGNAETKKLNGIPLAHLYPGTDAGAKIGAAIADLPTTGGVVAVQFDGPQTISWDIFGGVTKPVTLQFVGSTVYTLTANAVVPANVTLSFVGTSRLEPSPTACGGAQCILTIRGDIEAGRRHIFSTAGISFDSNAKLGKLYPEWWGAKGDDNGNAGGTDDTAAINAAISAARTGPLTHRPAVVLRGRYKITSMIDARDFGVYPGLRIEGEGAGPEIRCYGLANRPALNVAGSSYQLRDFTLAAGKYDGTQGCLLGLTFYRTPTSAGSNSLASNLVVVGTWNAAAVYFIADDVRTLHDFHVWQLADSYGVVIADRNVLSAATVPVPAAYLPAILAREQDNSAAGDSNCVATWQGGTIWMAAESPTPASVGLWDTSGQSHVYSGLSLTAPESAIAVQLGQAAGHALQNVEFRDNRLESVTTFVQQLDTLVGFLFEGNNFAPRDYAGGHLMFSAAPDMVLVNAYIAGNYDAVYLGPGVQHRYTFGGVLNSIILAPVAAVESVVSGGPNFANSAITAYSVSMTGGTGAASSLIQETSTGTMSNTSTSTGTFAHVGNVSINGVAQPSAPSLTPHAADDGVTYGYKIAACLDLSCTNHTQASNETTNGRGPTTLNSSNYFTVAWSRITGALHYGVYRTTGGAAQGKIAITTALTLNDTGLTASGDAPTYNNSGGLGLQVLLDFYRAASATATSPGQCYWNTGTNSLTCSTGAGAWQDYAALTPVAHASRHAAAGADPLSGLSPSQITGTAVITSDSRLSDARTPVTHATSHGTGQTDAVTIAPGQISSVTGTGAAVLATSPTIAHPTITGAALFSSGAPQFSHPKSWYFDDFISRPYASSTNLGSCGGGDSWSITPGDANHPGTISSYSGTGTAPCGRSLNIAYAGGLGYLTVAPFWRLDMMSKPSLITDARVRFGMLYVTAADPPAAGIYFEFDSSVGANWYAKACDGGNTTSVNTGVAATTDWMLFRIEGDATSARFYLADTLVATITAYRPSAGWMSFSPGQQAITLINTPGLSVYTDYISWFRDVTR